MREAAFPDGWDAARSEARSVAASRLSGRLVSGVMLVIPYRSASVSALHSGHSSEVLSLFPDRPRLDGLPARYGLQPPVPAVHPTVAAIMIIGPWRRSIITTTETKSTVTI